MSVAQQGAQGSGNGAPPRISLRQLSKYFDRWVALDRIDLTIEPSEFVVVLGRNGAGKTTLLRVLGLLQHPSMGELFYDEQPAARLPPSFRRLIGFVGHETFLYDELTAEENLLFYARLYGLLHPAARAAEVLEEMELAERRASLTRHLSRGMKQRLALARAWLHEPRILLLDEPATGLDAPTRARMHGWLARCHQQGRTVLASTHDLQESLEPATRLLLLEQGRVVFDGPNLLTSQREIRRRLGGPS